MKNIIKAVLITATTVTWWVFATAYVVDHAPVPTVISVVALFGFYLVGIGIAMFLLWLLVDET